jgi:aminoglycoside phosphotransferase (APT) family kinase protein
MKMTEMRDPREQKLQRWIESELGMRVVSMQRQARWRPCWFVEAERGGTTKQLYARGRREQAELTFFPLAHEAAILRAFRRNGIPAPEIHGMCPDPEAIVMDRMPGRADLSTEPDPVLRQAALDDMMGWLVRVHALPVAAFSEAGLPAAEGEAVTFGLFDHFEAIYRGAKKRPEPAIEFLAGWLRRNAPAPLPQAHFITGDSGQFMFENGKVTSLIDLELGHFGDPAFDLASLLLRDLSEPLGDLAAAFATYRRLTEAPIDPARIDYFVALWGLMTPFTVSALMRDPTPELDLRIYLEMYYVLMAVPLEAAARLAGMVLEPEPALPAVVPSEAVAAARASIASALADVPAETPLAAYRRGCAAEVADYLAILAVQEPGILAAERAEAAALLGQDIAEAGAREAALEAFVLAAGPEADATLLRFFHKQVTRRLALLGDMPGKMFKRRRVQQIWAP